MPNLCIYTTFMQIYDIKFTIYNNVNINLKVDLATPPQGYSFTLETHKRSNRADILPNKLVKNNIRLKSVLVINLVCLKITFAKYSYFLIART